MSDFVVKNSLNMEYSRNRVRNSNYLTLSFQSSNTYGIYRDSIYSRERTLTGGGTFGTEHYKSLLQMDPNARNVNVKN